MRNTQKKLIRALLPGGMLSPVELIEILHAAKKLGNKTVQFGSRQDILFSAENATEYDISTVCIGLPTEYEWAEQERQNIVSSSIAAEIQPSTNWVHTGTYLHLVDSFNFTPKMRINIIDPLQRLVPAFSGNLNFIASKHEGYWFLYLRLPHWKTTRRWPVLIDSSDLPAVAEYLDKASIEDSKDGMLKLFEATNDKLALKNKIIDYELRTSTSFFTQYEGIHKMETSNDYWAGFYWRNNKFDIGFLEAVSRLCLRTGQNTIYLSPWKSFLVKDIKKADLIQWEKLIGKHGITMRHSSLELNWHLPVGDEKAFALKRDIIGSLDVKDIRIEGISLAIQPSVHNAFTMVAIVPNKESKLFGIFPMRKTFSVYRTKYFTTDSREYVLYEENLFKSQLIETIDRLSKEFFHQLSEINKVDEDEMHLEESREFVYQCSNCLTVYEPEIGDPSMEVPPGTSFASLPEAYCCPVCESPKKYFTHKPLSNIYV